MPRDGNSIQIARAKYRSKRVLASNVTFVKLEISQDLISPNLTRYKITRNVLKRLLRFLPASRLTLIHPLFSFLSPFQDPFPRSFTSREKLEGELWFSDSPPNGKRSSNPSVEKKQRGIVYCACPGTNFPTECQIFVLDNLCGGGRGNIWQMHRCHYGPEPNVKREFWSQRPGGWILSLSLLILHNSALELRHSRVSFILRLIGPVAGGILTSYRRWWWIFEFGESWETRICSTVSGIERKDESWIDD